MLKLLLLRFWPALIPVALYVVWRVIRRKKADADIIEVKETNDEGKWWWITLLSSLAIALIMLAFIAFETQPRDFGDYNPPKVVDGQVVPAHSK